MDILIRPGTETYNQLQQILAEDRLYEVQTNVLKALLKYHKFREHYEKCDKIDKHLKEREIDRPLTLQLMLDRFGFLDWGTVCDLDVKGNLRLQWSDTGGLELLDKFNDRTVLALPHIRTIKQIEALHLLLTDREFTKYPDIEPDEEES